MADERKLLHASLNLKEAGHRLELSRECICSAHLYFHKFHELREVLDVELTAAACLWTSSRVHEESNIKLKDIISVFYRLKYPEKEALEDGVIFWSLMDSVTAMELLVLRTLSFRIIYKLPHETLLAFTESLNNQLVCGQEDKVLFARVSWSLLNDFFTSRLILKHIHSLETLSIAIMQISLKECGLIPAIPGHLKWEQYLKKDVNATLLLVMRQDIEKAYLPFIEKTF
jgi:hypothetical protein